MKVLGNLPIIAMALVLISCDELTDDGRSLNLSESDDLDEFEIETAEQSLTGDRHEKATKMGLADWATSSVVSKLRLESKNGDTSSYWDPKSESHFDNCYWKESVQRLWHLQDSAVVNAMVYDATNNPYFLERMYDDLGFALHIVQDFFAHSNWVDTKVTGHVPDFDSLTPPPGWYSGLYANGGDNTPFSSFIPSGYYKCPAGTPTHNELNKDNAAKGNNEEALFDAAIATANLIEEFGDDIRDSLGFSQGNALLGKIGFYTNPPSRLGWRTDYKRTLDLGGTSWGRWLPSVFCPADSYVVAFRQRVESSQGSGDDTALNSVSFRCRKQNGVFTKFLNSWDGLWGSRSTWYTATTSNGPFTGGALKIEGAQGSGDDTAANAARFWAKDGTLKTASNDQAWGSWKSRRNCGYNEAICGMRVRVEAHVGGSDDTALNNLKLHCCSL